MLGAEFVASMLAGLLTAAAGIIAGWLGTRAAKQQAKIEKEIADASGAMAHEHQVVHTKINALLSDQCRHENLVNQRDTSAALKSAILAIISSERQTPAVEHLISGYHEQALNQARAQFWFSVAAASAGFVWILYAAVDIRADNWAAIVKTLPGVVMDAVAFLFFKQASETRQRATDLYDRLRKDKQMAESIALVSSIEDPKVRSAVKAQMALSMAGLNPSPINLTNFLSPSVESQRAEEVSTKAEESAPPPPVSLVHKN